MDQAKLQQLEAKGWKVGNTAEFLELTPEENAFIELKLALLTQKNNVNLPTQLLSNYNILQNKLQ